MGLIALGNKLEHEGKWTLISTACFFVALVIRTDPFSNLLGFFGSQAIHTAALSGTFLLSGLPQSIEAICVASSGTIDTHVLMSLAIVGCLVMGMAQEGALLVLLFQISHTLEEKFTSRANSSLERLFSSIPTQAALVDVELGPSTDPSSPPPLQPILKGARTVLARSLTPGQHVLVKPGEQVPLDGIVAWGTASCSMAHISGESQPIPVEPGSPLPAGSMNTDGLLVVRVTATVDDSTPARMAKMTADAQKAKPKLQRTLDKVGQIWSKAVILATLLTLVVLPLFFDVPLLGPRGALYRAMGVLTAGSPCAVVLVPLAYVCAIATITRRGLLVKSAASIDQLHECDTIALDKTGTITSGSLTLTDTRVLCNSSACSTFFSDQSSASSPRSPAGDKALRAFEDGGFNVGGSSPPCPSFPSSSSPQPPPTSLCSASMQFCVALSQGSNHPVSRAVVEASKSLMHASMRSSSSAGNVQVSKFEQVPGLGVQGVCHLEGVEPMMVRFGSFAFVRSSLPADSGALRQLALAQEEQSSISSKAMSFLTATPLGSSGQASGIKAGVQDPLVSALSSSSPEGEVFFSSSQLQSSSGLLGVTLKTTPPLPSAQPRYQSSTSSSEPAFIAMLCFDDAVQSSVAAAVDSLKSGTWRRGGGSKKSVVMLTGDNHKVAETVARQVSIDEFHSGLKPQDKLDFITSFENSPRKLLMMGDGINDAPALAAAHVGIAIANKPGDLVSAAADIIILNGQGVSNLPWLFAFAHKTSSVIRQSLVLALVSVVFATLPVLVGAFPLWLAVLLHEGATVLVALNSLRLLLDPFTPTLEGAMSSGIAALKEMFS